MKNALIGKRYCSRALIASILFMIAYSAIANEKDMIAYTAIPNEEDRREVKSPIRLNKEMISGLGLAPFPWADEARQAKWEHLFVGEELSVSVFESVPSKAKNGPSPSRSRVRDYPYDQFVLVLSGKSVLTDESGESQTFVTGDFFVVPKGFNGIWEDHGAYRELIVIWKEAERTRTLDIEHIP